MFSVGPNYNKLKTNLRLAVSRLKLLEKKKTELTQKARKEIADYISQNKDDRARIRVEHIIREDYLVEALEIVEMYCDLLLARFGLIQQMKTLDEGIEEAINSVLWVAPRLLTEIQELKPIADELTAKYGKPFADACRENKLGRVNPKLLHKLAVHAPPKILVEKYMVEIAKSHNVPFTPDPNVMRDDEVAAAEAMLIDFQNRGEQGYGWMYPPQVTNHTQGPPPPTNMYPGVPHGPPQPVVQPFNYPPPAGSASAPPELKVPLNDNGEPTAPPELKSMPPPYTTLPDLPEPPINFPTPPDNNDDFHGSNGTGGGHAGGGSTAPNDDLDFEDLSRRFEELRKKR